jgi:hypothetical protein
VWIDRFQAQRPDQQVGGLVVTTESGQVDSSQALAEAHGVPLSDDVLH